MTVTSESQDAERREQQEPLNQEEHRMEETSGDSNNDINHSETKDEWEEEESYIVLDLGHAKQLLADLPSLLPAGQSNTEDSGVQLIGLEGPQPILRIGPYTFAGKVEESVGSNLIFERHSLASPKDHSPTTGGEPAKDEFLAQSNPEDSKLTSFISYAGSTTRRILFSQVLLEERKPLASPNTCSIPSSSSSLIASFSLPVADIPTPLALSSSSTSSPPQRL